MGSALQDFLHLVRTPDSKWDLMRLSLELSRIVTEPLVLETYLSRVEEIAQAARSQLSSNADLFSRINTLNEIFFQKYAFRGNREDYYDPRNSFMTLVLDRRKGIPITLSILYREIAARLGLDLHCVGMPGHFLLKYRMVEREIFIDPFGEGRILLADECLSMLEQLYEPDEIIPAPEMLQTTPNRAVLLRLLVNLKDIYRERGNSSMLLEILDRRIPLLYEPYPEILERGLVKVGLEDYSGACRDLEHCYDSAPKGELKETLGKQLERIRRLARGS